MIRCPKREVDDKRVNEDLLSEKTWQDKKWGATRDIQYWFAKKGMNSMGVSTFML
jgi:hypothetical protein